ncbi:MAG: hypothetical protein ACK45T_13370 [Pseudanabaena sp.]|jgi:hypothetical protein
MINIFLQIIKELFLKMWVNQPINPDQFSQRPDLTNDEFLEGLYLSTENEFALAQKTVECCRRQLEKAYQVPANKFYPNDSFLDIINLPNSDWDMLELVFALEETLGIDIGEEQVPNWTDKEMTLGKWIKEFISRVSQSSRVR